MTFFTASAFSGFDMQLQKIQMGRKILVLAMLAGVAATGVRAEAASGTPGLRPGAERAAAGAPDGSDDPMLRAMQQELEREKTQLVLPGMQHPYFIEYHLDDIETYEAVANYGALTQEQANHQRIVRVSVRIGDYTSDSSTSRGDGSVQLAPKDNNPLALRYALWVATDEAYKSALRSYSTKQANLKRFQNAPGQHDFSEAKPVTHIEPLVSMNLDRNSWKKRIVEASGLYASDPEVRSFSEHVQYSTVNIRAVAMNRYLVNTEGTVVRKGGTNYTAGISLGGQAADGMRLGRDNGSVATESKNLESEAVFRKRVLDDLKSFEALREAPVVSSEDYHGPVLFSGDAASDVFVRLFAPNVEADRPEMGTSARTQGAYNSSLHASVLPEILSVTDDPGLKSFNGQQLVGSYAVDDEGVPAEAVNIAVNGKLQNYLVGREPVREFPTSNGHGRAAPGQQAHSHFGVMVVKSNQPQTPEAMNAKLLAMAKEQGHDVYAVETLVGELLPRVLYRVHADGSRTLVRGANFDELDIRSLRSDIVAAGDAASSYVANSTGPIPQSMVTPAILFGDIGVKRASSEEQQKLPYYGPPPSQDRK